MTRIIIISPAETDRAEQKITIIPKIFKSSFPCSGRFPHHPFLRECCHVVPSTRNPGAATSCQTASSRWSGDTSYPALVVQSSFNHPRPRILAAPHFTTRRSTTLLVGGRRRAAQSRPYRESVCIKTASIPRSASFAAGPRHLKHRARFPSPAARRFPGRELRSQLSRRPGPRLLLRTPPPQITRCSPQSRSSRSSTSSAHVSHSHARSRGPTRGQTLSRETDVRAQLRQHRFRLADWLALRAGVNQPSKQEDLTT